MRDHIVATDTSGIGSEESGIGSEHLMQLFDSEESRTDAVVEFLGEGFSQGETLLAVMDEQRWYPVAMRLAADGFPVDEALRTKRVIVRGAAETLKRFMRRGRPDRDLFEQSVGHIVRELSRRGSLRVYGEMVDVLAAQGEYRAALELEELWNDLGRHSEFTLFCGYASGHFGDPKQANALRRICRSHSHVLSTREDVLGSFLLRENRASG